MNIVIAGGGVSGQTLAEELSEEGADIVLIEQDPDLLEKIIGRIDIAGVAGNAASPKNLLEAGVKDADIYISVTSSDEINLISAIMARSIGAEFTVARVRNPEYTDHHREYVQRDLGKDLGLSMLINPEQAAAQDIAQMIKFPEANSVEHFSSNRVTLIELNVPEGSPLDGMSLREFGRVYKDVLLITIMRGDDILVPAGDAFIHRNDTIFIIGSRPAVNSFYRRAGYRKERIHNSMIIGAGDIAYYLIDYLNINHVDVKMVCQNYEEALKFSENFPKAVIVYGDTLDQNFLKEERIGTYDSVISLSNHDEENILNSLYALSLDVEKVVAKVSNVSLLKILGSLELHSIVTPKYIMNHRILRFVRSLTADSTSSVEALIRIADNKVEVVQFLVKESSRIIARPFREVKMRENTIVAFISRGDELIIPRGHNSIHAGDHVIIATTLPHIEEIDDILVDRGEE